jgi:Fic family protein
MSYKPPFKITNKIMMLVSDIATEATRLNDFRYLDRSPRLRRDNRIESIHSSLAIEANSLSLDEVKSVINGIPVLGPQKDIQEVKDAIAAYDVMEKVRPFSLEDFLRVHSLLTEHTVRESGHYRSGGEGVFDGDRCIFMAPPPEMVPSLMDDLFEWVRASSKTVHPLIYSSVFHFEMVFIHPFSDGNGRMARYWQSVLLGSANPLFYYLPLENEIKNNQEGYYEAIALSENRGDSTVFVEFMLSMILSSLKGVSVSKNLADLSPFEKKLLESMLDGESYSLTELMAKIRLKSRSAFLKNYLRPLMDKGLVAMTLPDAKRSRNQRYRKTI